MANTYFQFKEFIVNQDKCAMKVTTDACLFGAYVADKIRNWEFGLRDTGISVLDIGSGTGLLSLMIAQKNNFRIDAVEIDSLAAKQAKENVAASPWKDRINIINQNILEFKSEHQYDVIISNPPFYENELMGPREEKNVAHHSGGLLFSELFKIIKKNLNDQGRFFLLLPYKRKDELMEGLDKEGLYVHEKVLVRATNKHQPTRIMIGGGKLKNEKEKESVLDIKNGNEYSNEFVELLRDYYLNL